MAFKRDQGVESAPLVPLSLPHRTPSASTRGSCALEAYIGLTALSVLRAASSYTPRKISLASKCSRQSPLSSAGSLSDWRFAARSPWLHVTRRHQHSGFRAALAVRELPSPPISPAAGQDGGPPPPATHAASAEASPVSKLLVEHRPAELENGQVVTYVQANDEPIRVLFHRDRTLKPVEGLEAYAAFLYLPDEQVRDHCPRILDLR